MAALALLPSAALFTFTFALSILVGAPPSGPEPELDHAFVTLLRGALPERPPSSSGDLLLEAAEGFHLRSLTDDPPDQTEAARAARLLQLWTAAGAGLPDPAWSRRPGDPPTCTLMRNQPDLLWFVLSALAAEDLQPATLHQVAVLAERLRLDGPDALALLIGAHISRHLRDRIGDDAEAAALVASAYHPDPEDDHRFAAVALSCMVKATDLITPGGRSIPARRLAMRTARRLHGLSGDAFAQALMAVSDEGGASLAIPLRITATAVGRGIERQQEARAAWYAWLARLGVDPP